MHVCSGVVAPLLPISLSPSYIPLSVAPPTGVGVGVAKEREEEITFQEISDYMTCHNECCDVIICHVHRIYCVCCDFCCIFIGVGTGGALGAIAPPIFYSLLYSPPNVG